MPTYNQAYFIRRAIASLLAQSYSKWELIIINDGSTDETETFIADYVSLPQVRYVRNELNQGLGHCLNQGMEMASYSHIAYLPSDDYYYPEHLANFAEFFDHDPSISLVFSGIKFMRNDTMTAFQLTESKTNRRGYSLQLVQTAHLKTEDRWVERSEWETDDLFVTFWHKLRTRGKFAATEQITCFWTLHPTQRHKLISEDQRGGLNQFRAHYHITQPIKLKVHSNKFVDEEKLYERFRDPQKPAPDGLKILLVGELAFNPERIYALEQAGHTLYGLWLKRPHISLNTVGPLPFGNVQDIDYNNWEQEVRRIKPDVVYALLNFPVVDLACDVLRKCPEIPFVWHFKEGPTVCLKRGTWDKLMYLYTHAHGKIYLNAYVKKWYEQFIPPQKFYMLLDGDLPKKDLLDKPYSPRLSARDGAIHTVVAGRMIGIGPSDMRALAAQNIHVHLYSENFLNNKETKNRELLAAAPNHFHVHENCPQNRWVEEFSRYDAGWLHCFESKNGGDMMKTSWDDLNLPARLGTYAAAGLPVIQRDNSGHIVAMHQIIEQMGVGIFFRQFEDLGALLYDEKAMAEKRRRMNEERGVFFFDTHVERLVAFFRETIKRAK